MSKWRQIWTDFWVICCNLLLKIKLNQNVLNTWPKLEFSSSIYGTQIIYTVVHQMNFIFFQAKFGNKLTFFVYIGKLHPLKFSFSIFCCTWNQASKSIKSSPIMILTWIVGIVSLQIDRFTFNELSVTNTNCYQFNCFKRI